MTTCYRTATNSARLRRRVVGIALVTPILLLAMALASNAAYATGAYYYADPNDGSEDILEKYSGWPDTKRCAACHKWQSPSSANLNPYGMAFKNNKNLSAIAGFDSDGDGVPNGSELQASLLPGLKTAAPTGLAASDDTYTDKVKVTWSAVPTPSGWNPLSLAQTSSYKVYRATSQGGSKAPLPGTVSAPSTSYNDTTANPGTTYTYWVKATSPGGQSAFSSSNTGRRKSTGAVSTLSKADKARMNPTLVQPPLTKRQAEFQKKLSKADKARLNPTLVQPQMTKQQAEIQKQLQAALEEARKPAAEKPKYKIKIDPEIAKLLMKKKDDDGLIQLAAPPTPGGVSASDGAYPDKVRVTWNAASGATSYRVYRATSQGGTKTQITSIPGTTADDTNVQPAVSYFYWVKACKSACSSYSSPDSGYKLALNVPGTPSGVSATDGTYPDKIQVTWNAVPAVTKYRVHRATSLMGTKTLVSESGTNLHNNSTAVQGTTYHFWIQACDNSGCSAYSVPDSGYLQ